MTRVLLDTHTFLWAGLRPEALGTAARAQIEDPDAELLVSMASVWEMAIKSSLGKLDLEVALNSFVRAGLARGGYRLLTIALEHVLAVEALPRHHRDPFDRLLIAQALSENCAILSRDDSFDAYGVERIW